MHMSIMRTPGIILAPRGVHRLETEEDRKEIVLEQMPIVRGKELCQSLRQMRVTLARVNGISYTPMECNHIGSCAGTCSLCDEEMRYINHELNKIPPEQRIYPKIYGGAGEEGDV